MSIKTLRKRIALVAVSALGVGLLSVTPASASTGDLYLGANGATVAATNATYTSTTSFGVISGDGQVTTTGTALAYSTAVLGIGVDWVSATICATVSGGTISAIANSSVLTGVTLIGDADSDISFLVTPTAAGTPVVIKSYTGCTSTSSVGTGTLTDTLTVTISAPSAVGTFSSSRSFLKVAAAATNQAVTDSSEDTTARTVANGGSGKIVFTARDTNGEQMPTSAVITATATGGAVVSLDGTTFGTAATGTYGGTYGNVYVAQGVANSPVTAGVVTISINGVVWATRTIKIVGDVDKITLSDQSIGARSADNAAGFYLSVLDSAGNLISGITPSVAASSYTDVVSTVTVAATSSYTLAKAQAFGCSATRGTSNITYTYTNARAQTITSNALPVVCAGGVYTYSASLDAASYAQGGVATLTVTAKDSQGKPVNDYATIGAGQSISCGSQMTAVTAPSSGDTFTNGAKKYTFTVGTTAGNYNCVVSLAAYNDSTVPQAAVTVPFSIKGDGSVSNAEVLAAIVKLIASINKQIAALQKSLKKK
jgi:hypothetical protein